jgi:succinate dehydrogenase / fumarate reductase iron-sulfur subunit
LAKAYSGLARGRSIAIQVQTGGFLTLAAKTPEILIVAEETMKIGIEIKRFNPEKDKAPYYQKYELEVEQSDRLLDALMKIKGFQDPGVGLRKSCAHGICGSDAMVINGQERLACKTLIKEVAEHEGAVVRIEPLRNLPVQRDLMVDQEKFFRNYRQVKPYLINDQEVTEKERIQSQEERARFDDATKCILCAACYSACPVIQDKNPEFLGPAAVVQASRFIEDSRDRGFEERLPQLDHPDGVWPCENRFQCTRVCPRSIKVTKLINLTKSKIGRFRAERKENIHHRQE